VNIQLATAPTSKQSQCSVYIEMWKRLKVTVVRRFEAAYVKCIKSFFGFERIDTVWLNVL